MITTILEFDNTKDLVKKIMREDNRCRNDDKWLCYKVLRHFTKAYIPYEDFDKFPSFETVTRCRRKIQNDDRELLPNTETSMNRKQRQTEVREWSYNCKD